MFLRDCRAQLVRRLSLLALLFGSSTAYGSVDAPPLAQLGEIILKEPTLQLDSLLGLANGDAYQIEEFGRMALQKGNSTLAEKLWSKARELNPEIAAPDVQWVFADLSSGNMESAKERLEQLRYQNSDDPHVLIAGAEMVAMQRDYAAANALLVRALEKGPTLAITHLTLGSFFERTGDLDSALSSYLKAAELKPERASGFLHAAALLIRRGEMEQALDMYRKAEKCQGRQPLAETRMGEVYFIKNDWYRAHHYYAKALTRDAQDPFPRLRLAQTLLKTSHNEEGMRELNRVIQDHKYPEAYRVAADHALANGNLDAAISLYRERVKGAPQDWVAANNLAICLVQTEGSADEALQMISSAEHSAPAGVSSVKGTKGCVLWYRGDYQGAEALLTQAVRETPNSAWTRYCLGKSLLKLGKTSIAQEQLSNCLFLEPAFPRKAEVEQLLAKPPAP